MNETESRILDANARWRGLSSLQLMENAGRAVAVEVLSRFRPARVAVLCGPGNNGGDGFVASRHLVAAGCRVAVILLSSEAGIRTVEAHRNWECLKASGVSAIAVPDSSGFREPLLRKSLASADVVVDAMLGGGQVGVPREPFKTAVKAVNALAAKRVCVDVPTGEGSSCRVNPDLTVSFELAKTRGAVVVGIGIPPAWKCLCGPGHVQALQRPRPAGRKGENGVLLAVGGSEEYSGAPLHSLRAAAGFVDLCLYHSPFALNLEAAKGLRREADVVVVPKRGLLAAARKSDAILIGPGLGVGGAQKKLVNYLCRAFGGSNKIVLDAGALKLVDKRFLNANFLLTPHAGEFKLIFGVEASGEACRKAAARYGCTILLKDKAVSGFDWVSDGKRLLKNASGVPQMTRGGTGDVLAGVAAAFSCKNPLPLSACAAAWLNGYAGELLRREKGSCFTATDLSRKLPEAFKNAVEF
ncbi:MAG: NAD(P)H-hydrate dehydratase [Candidatus Micrarchaeota archaeon]